ncbi:MAG: hypothetical protein AB1715_02540 [Acidobacteriota bacterium]
MAKVKKIIERSFLVLVAAAVVAQAVSIYLNWREGRSIRLEIWKSARVAVVKTDPQFPPGLLLEYENAGRWTIGKTHFRLTFDLDHQEVARTSRDYGELKPGKKVDILLKSVVSSSSIKAVEPGTKLRYHLVVYPDHRKPLPEIAGELTLK